jgi:hypothetical protein
VVVIQRFTIELRDERIDNIGWFVLGMLSKLFIRKSTKRNEFPFVEALVLYQKQIIREMFLFLNEFRNENPLDLMRMLLNR